MLIAALAQYFFGISIFISSIFLILLVLVQRGRGGGLAGALGGPGGQSAFGTKAGDLFTRITIGVAAVWIFLCAAAVYFLSSGGLPSTGVERTERPSLEAPGDEPGLEDSLLEPPPVGDASRESQPAGAAGVNAPAGQQPADPASQIPAPEIPPPPTSAAEGQTDDAAGDEAADPAPADPEQP